MSTARKYRSKACHLLRLLTCAVLISACNEPAKQKSAPARPTQHLDALNRPIESVRQLSISTNSETDFDVEIHTSKSANDSLCKEESSGRTVSIGPDKTTVSPLLFVYKYSPSIATYEWHICFEIDGTMYRGWRGFDPGFDTSLKVNCFIDTEQIAAKETAVYICQDVQVQHRRENHSEFASYCWNEKTCRSFENETFYNRFMKRGPENARVKRKKKPQNLAKRTVPLSPLNDEEWAHYLEKAKQELLSACQDERDPGPQPSWSIFSPEKSCEEAVNLEIDAFYRPNRRKIIMLNKADVLMAFDLDRKTERMPPRYPDLDRHFRRSEFGRKVFRLYPHKAEDHAVEFHKITCEHEHGDRISKCRLTLEHAFFADDPIEYFDVEDTTNVNVAVWAFREHKKTTTKFAKRYPWLSEEEEQQEFAFASRVLRDGTPVGSISVTDKYAAIIYVSGGCSFTARYRVIGDLEGLSFIGIERFCV